MFYMVCTIVPVFTVDRLGRRFTLFYGAVLQGICLILVAVLTKPDIMGMNPQAFGIGATVFTFGYTGVFGMTWLCVPWLYPVSVTLYLVWKWMVLWGWLEEKVGFAQGKYHQNGIIVG